MRAQPFQPPRRSAWRRPSGLILTTLASLTLAACAVGPTHVPPVTTATPAWQAPLPHGGDLAQLNTWWSAWNDPVLTALIDAAQNANPTLEQAAARIAQARATRTIAGASGWPSLDASGNARRGDNGDGLGVVSTTGASLQAAWELDLFGANRRGREAADARLGARGIDWHQARVSLAAEVATAYANLRIDDALAAGYERDAASRSETARLTGLKTDAGFEAPANASLARAGAAEARARLSAQRAAVELDIKALVSLTTLPEPRLREMIAAGRGQLPKPAGVAIEAVPAAVLAQRPDLAASERELAALVADIGAAEADRYPRITLTGSVGYGVSRIAGTTVDGATWGFGPAITLPLFDAGRRAANVELARARYDEALAGYKATAIRAVREVEEALTRIEDTRQRQPALQESVTDYQAFEKAAQARLSVGAGSVLELEDARRAVLAAQVALLALERERLLAWISLYRAAGGGWRPGDATPVAKTTPVSENK